MNTKKLTSYIDNLFENRLFMTSYIVIFAVPLVVSALLFTGVAIGAGIPLILFSVELAGQMPFGFFIGIFSWAAICIVGAIGWIKPTQKEKTDLVVYVAVGEIVLYVGVMVTVGNIT